VVVHLPLKLESKQQVLEMFDIKERIEYLLSLMESEIDILQVEKRIVAASNARWRRASASTT